MPELKVMIGAGDQSWDGWIATHKEQIDLLRRATWTAWLATVVPMRCCASMCWSI